MSWVGSWCFTGDDRYGPAWLFLATTGMRRGEVLGLRWTDQNLDASPATATVRRTAIAISHRREAGKTKREDQDRQGPSD
jgi:integrase